MNPDLQGQSPVALVVDDDATLRLLARMVLEEAGLTVEEAEHGAQALELYQRLKPDIVLMDVMMPEMDGFQACTALRRVPGGDQTPVLFMTGLDDMDSIARAYDAGATDFITKPWNVIILSERVRYMLRASQNLKAMRESEAGLAKARDQALEAAKLKTEFLATVSHELLTPMNGVMGMTSLLLETDLTDEQKEYTDDLQRSGHSLFRMIHDILTFSDIEAGAVQLKRAELDLPNTIETVVASHQEAAQRKSLTLTCSIGCQGPPSLYGDASAVQHVLSILTENAIKFTDKGKVSVHLCQGDALEHATTLRIEVADTGIGIEESVRGRLFHLFTQADGSCSRKHGGIGLGLVLAKKLTELMGGQIGVDSAPGKGSTFWFTVPLAKASAGHG